MGRCVYSGFMEITQTTQTFAIGTIVRDRNSLPSIWGRVQSEPDADGFVLFVPLNGSQPYGVYVGCLSLNAYR